jgi:hypothetical protein
MARAVKKSAGGKINLAPRVKKKKSTRNPLFMDETILIVVGVILIAIIILGKHLEQDLVHCCLDAK